MSAPVSLSVPPAADALATVRRDLRKLDRQLVELLLAAAAAQPVGTPAAASLVAPLDASAAPWVATLHACWPGALPPALIDVLARRIGGGARVAAAKLATRPAALLAAIRRGDRAAVEAAITHREVEHSVIDRAAALAAARWPAVAGAAAADRAPRIADAVAAVFRDVVIAATKALQVETLLRAPLPEERA